MEEQDRRGTLRGLRPGRRLTTRPIVGVAPRMMRRLPWTNSTLAFTEGPAAGEEIVGLPATRWEERVLCGSPAFVWQTTDLAVLHRSYCAVGHAYLNRLGLPDAVMYATCAAEVLLGLRVALGGPTTGPRS